jgi:hypothetical protein
MYTQQNLRPLQAKKLRADTGGKPAALEHGAQTSVKKQPGFIACLIPQGLQQLPERRVASLHVEIL